MGARPRPLAGLAPEEGLERHPSGAYHQTDCLFAGGRTIEPECGGTFRCSACRHTYGWCVGHDNGPHCNPPDHEGDFVVAFLNGPCTRCDRCCNILSAAAEKRASK